MASNSLKLAWRNLGRNRRRTVITGTALSVGMCLCVATYGLMDGLNADILHSLTRLDLGHVQVHHPRFPRKRTVKLTIPGSDKIIRQVDRLPGVAGWSPRVYGNGLVSHLNKSAGVMLVGVDPTAEKKVTELHRQIQHGRYLDASPTPWPRGRSLTDAERARDAALTRAAEDDAMAEIEQLDSLEPAADKNASSKAPARPAAALDGAARFQTHALATKIAPPPSRPPRIFIGANLAKILKAKNGARIYIMTQTLDGLAAEASFQIAGIFNTGTDTYDRTRIYLHIKDLQKFLRLDSRIHEINIRARAASEAGVLSGKLAQATAGAGVLVRAWDVVRPDIKNMLQLNSVTTGLMVFVIFLVAALGVINTMLMSVFERTRELGMLKAIGMSGGAILRLVVLETLLLVLVSSVIGTTLGLGLDLYMMVYGVDLSSFSGGISVGGMGVSPVIHGAITVEGLVTPTVTLGTMCFLAAFYPAIRAARMRPAQGMREV